MLLKWLLLASLPLLIAKLHSCYVEELKSEILKGHSQKIMEAKSQSWTFPGTSDSLILIATLTNYMSCCNAKSPYCYMLNFFATGWFNACQSLGTSLFSRLLCKCKELSQKFLCANVKGIKLNSCSLLD